MLFDQSVQARFERDPAFRTLVTHMEALLHRAQFTGTEIREAAMLAQMRVDARTLRPITFIPYSVPDDDTRFGG